MSSLCDSEVFYPTKSPILVHPDAIWALSWTPLNHLISASADGHLRIFDPSELTTPIHDLSSHPLAITTLSVSGNGKHAIASSLDGTIVMIDPAEGREVGRVETGREKAGVGENGTFTDACGSIGDISSNRTTSVCLRSSSDNGMLGVVWSFFQTCYQTDID